MTAIEEKGKEIKIIKKLQNILTKEEKKLYPNLIVITSSLSVPLATLFFIINWMHSNFKMIVTMNVRCSEKTAWMGKSLTQTHTYSDCSSNGHHVGVNWKMIMPNPMESPTTISAHSNASKNQT